MPTDTPRVNRGRVPADARAAPIGCDQRRDRRSIWGIRLVSCATAGKPWSCIEHDAPAIARRLARGHAFRG